MTRPSAPSRSAEESNVTFHRKQLGYSYAGPQGRDFRKADCSSATIPADNHARPGSQATISPMSLTQHIAFVLICVINWISQNRKKGKANFIH